MSLRSRVVYFNIGTGIATSTVVVPHLLGEAPKFLAFFHGGSTITDGQGNQLGAWRMAFGFANCIPGTPVNACLGVNAAGGTASTRGAREFISAVGCICLSNAGGTAPNGLAHVSAVSATTFTLTIDTAFTLSVKVGVLCLSGEDLTNVFVGTSTGPAVNGVFDLTGAGFNPAGNGHSLLLVAQTTQTALETCSAPAHMSVGAAVSTSQQCVVAQAVKNLASPTTCNRYSYDVECGGVPSLTGTGVSNRYDFDSWITDGVRLNQRERGIDSVKMIWAILEGPRFSIQKAVTSASVNGTVAVTGAGFRPVAALVWSTMAALSTNDTAENDAATSLGAWASDGSQHSGSGTDDSGVTTAVQSENVDPQACYLGATLATGAIDNPMRVKTIDADGATYVMTGAAPVGSHNFFSILMGPASSAPQALTAIPPFHTWSWQ